MVGGGGEEDCRLREDASPSALLAAKGAMLKVVALIVARKSRTMTVVLGTMSLNASSVFSDEHRRSID